MPVPPLRLLVLAGALLASPAASAQGRPLAPPRPDTLAAVYGSTAAVTFDLSEYGFGAGGAIRGALSRDVSAVVEVHAGAGRDEREQLLFIDPFGTTETPLKRNYVLIVPLHAGLERRLFRERVEDNFRPYVHLSAGPTAALQYPYFDDANANGIRDEGEARLGTFGGLGRARGRFGVGGTVAVGAFFGRSRRTAQAIRFGFTGNYFLEPVDLLEPSPEVERPSRRLFATPVVTFHVARMLE